ncbi:hypothetical protein [Aliarcobacter cryaerophilus]|uniref:hypothetical protein n=1 Tax=Aliarcobacter cryaerophilus TaxID=28198 RepID=UPI0021B683F5|nr:hypothetical protein [Aliarcobacter cryaerophilus]MCT7493453.1 hypothetical protein [Aliarcobacter cryaerophilus]
MANLAQIQSIAQGQFFVKDSLGNLVELKVGDTVSLNDTIVAASSNTDLSKIEILFDTNELIILSQGEQLLDATLLASTFGNEELAFDKQEVDETLNAWNNAQDGDATDMETAAGDVTEQATNAGDERAADGGALRSKFNSRDGDATDIVSDLREASWAGGIERTNEDSENMLLEQPLPVVYTIIEGIDVVNEGDSANYVVKLQDAAGNPVIATQDTIIYVRYTNKTTQDGDTQYNNENIIEVVIKAGTSQTEFTIKTNDDYLADNGEIYNVAITGNNSTEFDMRTGDVAGNKTNVDTTILDNSNPLNPGGEDGGHGSEDIVFAIIEGTTTVNEGDTAQYVVKLVDKDGNPVTVTKDTEVTIKYTNKTTQDGDTEYNNNDTIKITIKAGENSSDKFDVDTIDDYLADNGEKFNLEITNVDDQGQFEKVNIGDINGDKTNVDTTILDNTTDKPNENSTVESNQENVILKIVAADKDGNPIKDANGDYLTQNEVPEGNNAYYVVLAFEPNTTKFNDNTKLDIQSGTVEVQTFDKNATGTTTQTKEDGTQDYISKTQKVELGKVISVETLDDWKSDNNEQFEIKITDKSYQHPSTPVYENVVTNTDPVTTTIKDNTTPNTETNVEDVKIVLVAVSSATTTIADITNSDGTLKVTNTNETPEGGKLYYIAVAVDKDGKPLATQGGDVTINYGTTSNISDKDATAGVDYDNTIKVNTKVGVVFEVKTKDDYYAEGDENFTVKITDLKNSPYETPSIDTTKDTVTSTIKDNAPTINGTVVSGGEDTDGNTYGSEDTVYAIITGDTTVNEGGEVVYTVKLVDKDGNTVIPTKETTVTVTYTNIGTTSIDDTDKTNNQEIAVKIDASGKGTFTVETKDDYWAEADENYNVKITNVQNTGEFENVKFDSYPNTIPNSPSNNVTTTIKDNAPTINGTVVSGGEDTNSNTYGAEDTVYVKIEGNPTVVEGGKLSHTVTLVESDGFTPVTVPTGESVTVTLTYKEPANDKNPNEDDYVTKTVTVKIEGGTSSTTFENITKVDFVTEGKEIYEITISKVEQSGAFENVAIHSTDNKVTDTILDGITLGNPENAYVDEDNFYKNREDGTNSPTQNADKTITADTKNLGFKIPANYETEVGTFSVNFVGEPTIGGVSELTSNGVKITYGVNGNTIVGKAGSTKVFDIVLSKNGTYTYKQYANIDHPKEGNANTDYENVNTNDNIDLNFKFNITTKPKNGEPSKTSDTQGFTVTVNDSTPDAGTRTETVNEDGTLTIVLSDEGFQKDPKDPSTKGQIEIDNGKDGYQTIAKNGTVNIYDGDKIIGTLTNKGNGTLSFKPNTDYSKYEADNGYLPNFKYKVSDTDGDYAQGQINIHVKPVADGTTIKVENVTTYEDNKNTQEGQNSVSLGLVQPTIKDNTDKNDTAKGDHGERVDYITLKFTNGPSVKGAVLEKADGTDIATISSNNQTVEIVIVKADGSVDTDFHHSNITLGQSGVVYLTKEEYEGLKIQHAEDNDTDIKINISTKTYEVDDIGKPLSNVNSKSDNKTMTVIIKPVTDDIELTFDNATVNGESLGTISPDGKTFTYKNIDEGNTTIDLKALLTKTSGTELNDGTAGNKADLDGSEKRTYTISDIPEGTVITLTTLNSKGKALTTQTATAGKDGIATIVFDDVNNKNPDPEFSMKFPEHYSGTVDAKITLSVIDKGNGTEHTNTNGTEKIGADGQGEWGEVKTTEVNFKVNVTPVADDATVKVGQPVGYEDAGREGGNTKDKSGAITNPEKGIVLPITVTSTDKDGSETFTVTIKDIPNGSGLYVYDNSTKTYKLVEVSKDGKITIDGSEVKTSGNISVKDNNGKFEVEIKEYQNNEQPKFIPPHNSHGDFKLNVDAKTVDTVIIDGVEKTDTQTVATAKEITVIVKDVADSVVGNGYKTEELVLADSSKKSYNAITTEDTDIKLSSIFNNDGKGGFDYTKLASYDSSSEDLTIIIKDLPEDVTLEGNVNYINGQYIFKASDIGGITIKTPTNYSGELNFGITYITTERGEVVDGKTIASKTFGSEKSTDNVSIFVKPTIDAEFKSSTTKAEDIDATVVGGKSYYNLNLGINKNGDNDETLESVKLDKPVDGDFKLFIKNSDGSFTAITDFSKTYTAEEIKNIYVQAPENKHGDFTISGSFVAKDSQYAGKNVNYEATKTENFTHKLTITPVTDKPELKIESINDLTNSEVSGTKVLIKDSTASFTVNTKTTSVDTDGSEKVVKIVISGVPQGVTIANISDKLGQDKEGVSFYEHNGVYVIEVNENITSLNGILENIKFDINGGNFIDRDITITTYAEDSGNGDIKQDTEIINIVKDYGTGGGTGQGIVLETKPYNGAVEDTKFSLLNIFNVSGGQQTGDITIKVANGTIEGYTPDANGVYTIHLKGNAADIGTILSQIKVIPDLNFNDNKGEMQLTVSGFGLVDKIVDVAVTPVTDEAKLTITPIDSGTEISENGEFKFDIKLTNNVDVGTTLKDNVIYIKAVENYKDTAESATGKIYYIDANGDKQPLSADGKFELKDGYTIDNLPKFVYEAGENRNGNVTINVTSENKELNADNYKEANGSTTITVKPTVSSEIEIEKVQDGIEDGQMAGVKLNLTKADPSEKFESVLVKVVPGVAVYYDNGTKLAMNLGNDSWLIPVSGDGKTLPEIFFKGKEHFGGKVDFTATINVKDGESKVTTTLTGSVYIKEVADGVTIDPTKTGIDKNAFEWTTLNLNANMKDLDGSEKMHFTLEGLDSSAQFRVNNGDGTYTDLSSKASQDATGKWTIDYGIEAKDINNIEISHDKSVSGAKVEAWTVDGDNVSTSPSVSGTFDLSYKADAKFDNVTFTLAKDMDIDFNNIGKLGFTNVEKIDLGAQGENELLNLTLDDVLSIGKKDGNGNINLTILGDSDDKVTFKNEAGNEWELKTENMGKVEGDKTFDVYTNSGDPTVQVKVEDKISDGITS